MLKNKTVIYSSNKQAEKQTVMRFQERDGALLQAIYDNDGFLTRRHISSLFWNDKTIRPMERRLSKLRHSEYIHWPSEVQRKTKPIPEPICWLGWKGILYIAGKSGFEIEPPTRVNENQLRSLQERLRKIGIRWTREPRWQQLEHDIEVTDFRYAVERSVCEISDLTLEDWIPEGAFRSNMDKVDFRTVNREGKTQKRCKGVCPDGYFVIVDEKRKAQGKPYRARFLLELDMATHDNPSFGVEKAAAGAAYIHHPSYKARFGSNSGRWLIVTTGEVRMKNLMRQTLQNTKADSNLFLFTTFDRVMQHNLFNTPIWIKCGETEGSYLISE
ncbi:MAG TPA: hypothetical protein G4N92_04860 [Anaerolineae bacterium]|nr:hypothetical protein [Anaerolineae bacterium]